MHHGIYFRYVQTAGFKGVVHFKKTFADNLLAPVSSKMSMSEKKLRFLMKTFQDFSPYNGLQWGPNGSRCK